MDRTYDLAIIGGGPGGYTAALYAARAGLKTLVLEKLSPGGQMATTSTIDNYPGFDDGIDGFELGERMQNGAERFGAVTEYVDVRALTLSANPKRIVTNDGDFFARAVVIATGASSRKLGLDGEDALVGHGVAYCATCDGMRYKDKVVAVAGGGNSAAGEALILSNICKKVYLIHRRDELRASKVYLDQLQKAQNVAFIWDTQIDGLIHDENLSGLQLTDKKSGRHYALNCDGLFVAIGRKPNTALAAGQIELDEHGYIIADESTECSLPGVFAVGDVRTKPLRQIITAASDGAVAAMNAEAYIRTL
ncbi:MAG: thioredoxin-disulfide reductase [Oscillospiraceae bacterium]